MSTKRGLMIQEVVSAMNHEHYLRQLAKQRDNHMARKRARQRKEADTAATVTTSSDVNVKKSFNNYTKESEECQYVKSDTPGDTPGGEVRQQRCSELPVYLL